MIFDLGVNSHFKTFKINKRNRSITIRGAWVISLQL